MSPFLKLTQAIWHCQYPIDWVPKYRFRVLEGELAQEVRASIRIFTEQSHCEIVELNIPRDHVHLDHHGAAESLHLGADGTDQGVNSDSDVETI